MSVCMLKRYFVPFYATCAHFIKSSPEQMTKTKKTPFRKVHQDDGVRPSTSKETGEGPKKLEKKGEHSKWISFLNDFNMQYIPI